MVSRKSNLSNTKSHMRCVNTLQQNEMISQYKESTELAFQSLIPKGMFYWHTYDCFLVQSFVPVPKD